MGFNLKLTTEHAYSDYNWEEDLVPASFSSLSLSFLPGEVASLSNVHEVITPDLTIQVTRVIYTDNVSEPTFHLGYRVSRLVRGTPDEYHPEARYGYARAHLLLPKQNLAD